MQNLIYSLCVLTISIGFIGFVDIVNWDQELYFLLSQNDYPWDLSFYKTIEILSTAFIPIIAVFLAKSFQNYQHFKLKERSLRSLTAALYEVHQHSLAVFKDYQYEPRDENVKKKWLEQIYIKHQTLRNKLSTEYGRSIIYLNSNTLYKEKMEKYFKLLGNAIIAWRAEKIESIGSDESNSYLEDYNNQASKVIDSIIEIISEELTPQKKTLTSLLLYLVKDILHLY